MTFLEISKENFATINLNYPFKSRYLKSLDNVTKGFKAFAAVRSNEVIADLWYSTASQSGQASLHHDLEWLNISLGQNDAYGWDMYVKREDRSSGVAFYFINQALHRLREKGISKVYGFVFDDNIPACFMYRLFRFKELRKVKASRFFFYRRVTT